MSLPHVVLRGEGRGRGRNIERNNGKSELGFLGVVKAGPRAVSARGLRLLFGSPELGWWLVT